MSSRTVDIIGGGPAGLTAARLIKLTDPDAEVTVYERADSSTATFGFGVGLTGATMKNLSAIDPETADAIADASYAGHRLTLREDGRDVELHGARNLAIGRATLLGVLAKAATEIGVHVHTGIQYEFTESNADVIVAADGAHSSVRTKFESELGYSVTRGRLRFMWCGADFAVDTAFFSSRGTGDARFVAHAYPYADDRSTFLIEADETTWQAAGLDRFHDHVAPGETDHESIALLEKVFEEDLGGRDLLTNRTRWARFPTVSLKTWHTGNIVLIGDAAHTAHYTIGSGTKLAIEDAIALARALADTEDVTAAFTEYQRARQAPVDRFRLLAARSQSWWETYRDRLGRTPEQVALSYMTRAGNLTVADYAREYPDTVRTALTNLGSAPVDDPETLDDWLLSRPAPDLLGSDAIRALATAPTGPQVRIVEWSDPSPTSTAADAVCQAVAADADHPIVMLTGPDTPTDVGCRIDLAERLRTGSMRTVVVAVPAADRSTAAAAIAAGRADAVVFTQ